MQTKKDWSEIEIKELIKLFPNKYNSEIAKIINRSISSVINKSRRLGLEKSSEHKSKCISKRNKMVGRDINYEFVKQEALKYKSRAEFQLKDSSCYKFARENEILEEVCSHMITISYSIPQLILKDILENILKEKCSYNDRRTIKPYELDIFFKKYKLAFEYNGKGWHINNERDQKKINICNEKNIKIIYIIENNRKYEEDIKNQLIDKLFEINKITNLNINISDIQNYTIGDIFKNLYDENEIIKITNKYDNLKDFRKQERKLYEKLIKLKISKKYTSHMYKSGISPTIDDLKKEIKKYEFLLDFIKEKNSLYQYIKRHKLSYLLDGLKRKRKYKQ